MTDDPMHHTEVHSAEPHTLHNARRCGAKTRSGRPCRSPAVHGRSRCRMHGCAPGAGGPEGERNGNYRHGLSTKETRMRLRAMRDLRREVKDLTRKLRGGLRSGKRG
jgi:hypothetical protein